MSATRTRWKKSPDVPGEFYENVGTENRPHHKDRINLVPGYRRGPLAISKGTYGWQVFHVASRLKAFKGVAFRTKHAAVFYADGLLALEGARDYLDAAGLDGEANDYPGAREIQKRINDYARANRAQ